LGARGEPPPPPGNKRLMNDFWIGARYLRLGKAHEFSVILK
jgi:hypothetical protein